MIAYQLLTEEQEKRRTKTSQPEKERVKIFNEVANKLEK